MHKQAIGQESSRAIFTFGERLLERLECGVIHDVALGIRQRRQVHCVAAASQWTLVDTQQLGG
jgi:hypothetical protein